MLGEVGVEPIRRRKSGNRGVELIRIRDCGNRDFLSQSECVTVVTVEKNAWPWYRGS